MDALIGFAIGVLAGLAIRAILPAFIVRQETPHSMARRRIGALSGLGARERLFHLALLLQEVAPGHRVADTALYDPERAPDPEALEREILARARPERRGR